MVHVADIYSKSTVTGDSGQRIASWAKIEESNCNFVPNRTNIRIIPISTESDIDMIFFPHDATITYSTRIQNLRDRKTGEVIDAGPMEVVSIKKLIGYSGVVNHLQVRVETVTE